MKYIIIHPGSSVPLQMDILKNRGFSYIFNRDGSVTKLDKPDFDSAYSLDTLSGPSMHVIYDGDGYADDRTYKQYDAMEIFMKYHVLIYPKVKIAGIYQVEETNEPGFEVPAWLKEISLIKNSYDG